MLKKKKEKLQRQDKHVIRSKLKFLQNIKNKIDACTMVLENNEKLIGKNKLDEIENLGKHLIDLQDHRAELIEEINDIKKDKNLIKQKILTSKKMNNIRFVS